MFKEIEVVIWDTQSRTWIWLRFVLGYREDNEPIFPGIEDKVLLKVASDLTI